MSELHMFADFYLGLNLNANTLIADKPLSEYQTHAPTSARAVKSEYV